MGACPSSTACPRVLVVDDEENIRYLLSAALSHAGFEVAEADTGRAALDGVRLFRPDAVLLDVMLPDLDGFEVLPAPPQRGRPDRRHLPHRARRDRGEGARA